MFGRVKWQFSWRCIQSFWNATNCHCKCLRWGCTLWPASTRSVCLPSFISDIWRWIICTILSPITIIQRMTPFPADHYFLHLLFTYFEHRRPLIKYGVEGQRESAMSAKFNQVGSNILALMRRSGPVLYDIANKDVPMKFSHADYKNICTLKSPCFVGEADEVR